jgi:hypothetical protein
MSTTVYRTAWRRALLAFLLILFADAACASQAAIPAAASAGADAGLKEVGRLSWPGAHRGEASPCPLDGRGSDVEPGRAVALSLACEHGFSRAELSRIRTGEYAGLGLAGPEARARWFERIGTPWHDVRPGGTMPAPVVPGAATRLSDGNRLLGAIEGPQVGSPDLSIRIDPRSAVRDLRAELPGPGRC